MSMKGSYTLALSLLLAAFVFRECGASSLPFNAWEAGVNLASQGNYVPRQGGYNGSRCAWVAQKNDKEDRFFILDCLVNLSSNNRDGMLLSSEHVNAEAKVLKLRCVRDRQNKSLFRLRDIVDKVVSVMEKSNQRDPWRGLQSIIVIDCPLTSERPLQRLDLLFIASSLSSDLKSLVIRHSDFNPNDHFVMESDAFRDGPTHLLRSLELSSLSIKAIPHGLFCPLQSSLVSLNLSFNELHSVAEVGLNSDCPMQRLTQLDLSHNHLNKLNRHGLSASLAFGLRRLDLSYNQLNLLEDAALDGLGGQLHQLNLAHNALTSLPVNLFGQSSDKSKQPLALRELYLSNNTLSGLPTGFLDRLTHLVVLNLSNNAISNKWLDSKLAAFKALRNLVALDLSHNQLNRISENMFSGLNALQVLTVSHNRIHTVSAKGFLGLRQSLHALVLSHNQLEGFEDMAFEGLTRLSSLAIDHNRIKGLNR